MELILSDSVIKVKKEKNLDRVEEICFCRRE